MHLNIAKIEAEMERLNVNRRWLAEKLNVSPGMVTYIFNTRPIAYAEKMGKIFNLSGKDFIIEE